MILKYSLGIDVDSKELEANLSVIDEKQQVKVISSRKFPNTLGGFKKLIVWIKIEMRGYKSKTDKLDAKGLAQMAAEQCLRQWHPAPQFYQELRSLTRHYQSVQQMKTMANNR